MKQLTLVPEGGLCNRIYAITSAIGFAKEYNLQLTIYWFKDRGMGAGFYDLFNLSPIVENVTIKDASFTDFFKYAKPIKSNFFLPKLYQILKFDNVYSWDEHCKSIPAEKWYLSLKNTDKIYLMHCWKFYDNISFFDVLHPINSIQIRITEQLNLISSHTIGIHIRRTDSTDAIKHSPLTAFIKKMQQEVIVDSKVNFYVASDSSEEKNKLRNIFGSRIIIVDNILKRDTKNGIIDALIELYTLASTKKIYGSFQSTYSILASEIKGIPLEIIVEEKNSK